MTMRARRASVITASRLVSCSSGRKRPGPGMNRIVHTTLRTANPAESRVCSRERQICERREPQHQGGQSRLQPFRLEAERFHSGSPTSDATRPAAAASVVTAFGDSSARRAGALGDVGHVISCPRG